MKLRLRNMQVKLLGARLPKWVKKPFEFKLEVIKPAIAGFITSKEHFFL